MNILQRIFTDYYEEIKYTLHPRNTEMENIDKMINCGDPSFGGAMYACPHCGKLKFVPFRCHSRFCPTCGNKYSRDLKWNPHIHCLISEGGYSNDGFWCHVKYFNYTYLRNAFRTSLLNELESHLGPSFKKQKQNAILTICMVFMFIF